jgi:hypothetical protein
MPFIHYPDLQNLLAYNNNKFVIFGNELKCLFCNKGNPLILEAIAVYNKNIAMYNRLLEITITYEQELISYNKLRLEFRANYQRYLYHLALVHKARINI